MKRKLFTMIIALFIGATSFGQLSGTYYIPTGSPGYSTLQAAIADLNTLGINGDMTFIVADDYTETAPIGGYLLGNTLLNANSVTYSIKFQRSGTGTNAPLLTAWEGTTTNLDAIWRIAGTDNVTIDGIDLTESAGNTDQLSRMEFGYAMVKLSNVAPFDGCQNVTIKNCTITLNKAPAPTNPTNCTGIYAGNNLATSTVAIDLTGGNTSDAMNDCKFFNNVITNVKNGIDITGWNNAPAPYDMFNQNIQIGLDGANAITDFNTYGISARYMKALTVANNNISTYTATPVSSLIGIILPSVSTNFDIFNNTVTLAPTAGFVSLSGISAQTGDPAFASNVYNNTVQNCTNNPLATYQAFSGITCSGSAGTLNIYSNTVTNNNIPGTGSFTGIDSPSSAGNLSMYNNTVSNNTKTGTSGTFVCMRVATGNAYDNNIFSNYNTTSAGANQGGTMTGINFTNGNPGKLYKNNVYDLSAGGSASNVAVNGITVAGGTDMNVYNNFISDLRTPQGTGTLINPVNSIAGINVSYGTNVNVFYNTVYLNASSTGTYFYTSALYVSTNPTLDLRNNVFVNLSTTTGGIVSAYRRSAEVAGLPTYSNNSNANVFYVNEEEVNFLCVTYFDGTNPYFFTDYQALVGPTRDAGSFRELPPFVNVSTTPYDMHMLTTVVTNCESGGTQITSPIAITDDFDGDTRSLLPDIGADEFAGMPAVAVLNPGGVNATLISSSQINVAFVPNPANNNVVIAWNTTGTFTAPTGAPPSNIGDPFAGGNLLYYGTTSPVNHSGLSGATTYYYKAFSYDGSAYSLGVAVSAITNIDPPSAFTATTISATQIDLAWTKNAYNSDVIIATTFDGTFGQPVNGTAYIAGNSIPGGGEVVYVGPLTAFSHTGLISNLTTYYYKAWSYEPANNNIYSPTGVTASAATLCGTFALPFAEDFETNSIGCGTVLDINQNGTWSPYYNTNYAHSGANSLRITQYAAGNDWYITNGLELTGGETYEVRFWYRTQVTSGNTHQLEVKWGNSPTQAGMTSSPIYYNTSLTATTTYIEIVCSSFTPATSGNYYVGWHDFTAVTAGSSLYIDDLSVTVTNVPASISWTGAVNSDWFNSGNWNPVGVPGAITAVTIPAELTNYPTITTPASCSSIVIASDASLLDNGNLTVSGTTTVNRDYTGGEWHLISSPVSGATANMFLGLYLQNHTESTNLYTDVTNPAAPLNVMQGYALWNDMAGTAIFVGTLNTGNIGAANNVTRNGEGWNLVGNPYASAIDWDAASGWTKTNVDNATYRHVNSATWASYVGGVGNNGGSQYIPSCQGFFVGVTDGFTVGTLNMTNEVRTNTTSTFYKDDVADILRLTVSGNGYTDETVIRFLDEATPGFDGQWDAHKLFGDVAESPAIYSVDNGMMAINSLPATNTVQVGVKAGVPGEFTIAATETSEFANVILEDLMTGAITDLKNSPYSFNYDMSFDNRFVLHFTPMSVVDNQVEPVNIFSNNGDICVIVPLKTNGNIIIYSLMGQEIFRTPIKGTLNRVPLSKSAYYIVKVVSNDGLVTKKVYNK